MDINELSRRKYDDVPVGGTLFTIDKIGLQFPSNYLNKSNLKPWKKGNCITILTHGEIAQINIHAEFEPQEEHLGKRCLDAILLLILNDVFTYNFVYQFYIMLNFTYSFIFFDKSYSVMLLSCFFSVVEWEWAIDFLDYPLYSNIDISIENKKSLKKVKNSHYSRDDIQKKRLRERNGKMVKLSKGRQKSLYINYPCNSKIGIDRIVDRVEIRQQGKYKKDLSNELLIGNKEQALEKSAPKIKRAIKKIIHDDAFIFSDKWKDNLPIEYLMLFYD
ncbi:MAG: hypothetical protein FWC03_07000 [Treponema sp.]|nr:hypothetical protein [Treponema sp.]